MTAPDYDMLVRELRDAQGDGSDWTEELFSRAADAIGMLRRDMAEAFQHAESIRSWAAESRLARIRDIIDAVEPQSAVGPVGREIRVVANSPLPAEPRDWLRERDGHTWSAGCAFGAMHGYSDIHNPYQLRGSDQ